MNHSLTQKIIRASARELMAFGLIFLIGSHVWSANEDGDLKALPPADIAAICDGGLATQGDLSKDPARLEILRLEKLLNEEVIGLDHLVRRIIVALLTKTHLLIESQPGLGKTTVMKALSDNTNLSTKRIQFRPDLMPGEITGVERENVGFVRGPIFAQLVIADEINRGLPKTQSALLEPMQERQVTVGNATYPLPDDMIVIASQNPLEHVGTYPLPAVQLDRFGMMVRLTFPTPEVELAIARRRRSERAGGRVRENSPVSSESINAARKNSTKVQVPEAVEEFAVKLVQATRQIKTLIPKMDGWIQEGASPRATFTLLEAAEVHAYLEGRSTVEISDIVLFAQDVLQHRITLSPIAIAEGRSVNEIISEIIQKLTAAQR